MIEKKNVVKQKWKIRPARRLMQTSVMALLIAVPLISQNPNIWSPSLIVQGYDPLASLSYILGDTWSFAVGEFRILHPVAFLDVLSASKILTFSLFISVLIPLCMTFFLGRVFCSWICPIGFILEMTTKIRTFLKKKVYMPDVSLTDFRYIILVVSLLAGFVFACPVISIFDAPHVLGRELMFLFTHQHLSFCGIGFLGVIVLFEINFMSRAWCRYFCPSGGCLSLLGIKRILRIRSNQAECCGCDACQDICPYELMPGQFKFYKSPDWELCDNCGLCRDRCPTGAISYHLEVWSRKRLSKKV